MFASWEEIGSIRKQLLPFQERYSNFVILGTGGSTMIGQALHGLLPQANVHFWDNIDPHSWRFIENVSNACFIAISKSGNTSEILVQLTMLHPFLRDNILVVTQNDPNNRLRAWALEARWPIIDHPTDVGGRFSAFTVVGIIPCLLLGYDPEYLIGSAQKAIPALEAKAAEQAKLLVEAYRTGKRIHVLWGYGDRLSGFLHWNRQLIGESLGKQRNGKDAFGFTPVFNRGTIDEHSQLQLYLDGPQDKIFSFFHQPASENPTLLEETFADHLQAVYNTLQMEGHFVRSFEVGLHNIGEVLMYGILETLAVAQEAQVNPWDQPAVERCKKLMRNQA